MTMKNFNNEEMLLSEEETVEMANINHHVGATTIDMNSPKLQGYEAGEITYGLLESYLKNPYANIKKIRALSIYLANKHGIIKDVHRMIRSLPTLNFSLMWELDESLEDKSEELDKMARNFLDSIGVKQVVRDGLYETAEQGTTIVYLKNKKYVQFIDPDKVRIEKQRNGKWVVEYDLATIRDISQDGFRGYPDEVTPSAIKRYKQNGERYVELKNCYVVSSDAKRNTPWGFPFTMGAWLPLMQKDMIGDVERSVADRIIKQVLIIQGGWIDSGKKHPVGKETLSAYFNVITSVMNKKEADSKRGAKSGGVATLAIPHFIDLDTLQVNSKLFEKELYEKVNNDVYENLGVSPALIAGLDGNYASANINNEKFFSFIVSLQEQFEAVINEFLKVILPEGAECKILFDKTTVLDKKDKINQAREIYTQMGVAQPWIEAVFGEGTFQSFLRQAKYEKEELKTADVLYPAQNAYTMSGKAEPENMRGKGREEANPDSIEQTETHQGNRVGRPRGRPRNR